VIGAELAPLAQLVLQLTEMVEELSRGSQRGGAGVHSRTSDVAVDQNSMGGSLPRSVLDELGGMKMGEKTSLFKLNLAPVSVKNAGDSKFEATKQNWDHLVSQFDIIPKPQAKLPVHAFRGPAAVVFHQVAAANLAVDSEIMWDLMRGRLYNTVKVQSQRARFTASHMSRDETVRQFAERLRELSCGLPETLSD
jgi:hypothetical protein